jgi:hypothetical protein
MGIFDQVPDFGHEMTLLEDNFTSNYAEIIAPYLALGEKFTDINASTGRKYMSDMSAGVRIAGELWAKASFQYERAKDARKHEEAVAALDRFPSHVAQTGIKATDATREHFINSDGGVRMAKDKEHFYEAVLIKIKNDAFHLIECYQVAKMFAGGSSEAPKLPEIDK